MKTRILLFGTFDVLHEGHSDLFKQARGLAEDPYVIVSIARDANVQRIKQVPPHFSEEERRVAVEQSSYVDEAVLGAIDNYLDNIVKLKPDIIALGYDQEHYTDGLAEKLAERGLKVEIVRLKPYHPDIYKSSIIKKQRGIT